MSPTDSPLVHENAHYILRELIKKCPPIHTIYSHTLFYNFICFAISSGIKITLGYNIFVYLFEKNRNYNYNLTKLSKSDSLKFKKSALKNAQSSKSTKNYLNFSSYIWLVDSILDEEFFYNRNPV